MPDLAREVATACRVLGSQNIGLGVLAHVTAREPGANSFWTYQLGQSVEEVRVADVREVDFSLRILAGGGAVNPNLAIHSEIYAARPDVLAIVHHHGENGVALGSLGRCLEPFERAAARFHGLVKLVEEYESPKLREQGESLARSLGNGKAALMKGHGAFVTGENLADAVVSTIELERSCGTLLKALAVGEPEMIPDEEIEDARNGLGSRVYYQATWAWYVRRLKSLGLDAGIDDVGEATFQPVFLN